MGGPAIRLFRLARRKAGRRRTRRRSSRSHGSAHRRRPGPADGWGRGAVQARWPRFARRPRTDSSPTPRWRCPPRAPRLRPHPAIFSESPHLIVSQQSENRRRSQPQSGLRLQQQITVVSSQATFRGTDRHERDGRSNNGGLQVRADARDRPGQPDDVPGPEPTGPSGALAWRRLARRGRSGAASMTLRTLCERNAADVRLSIGVGKQLASATCVPPVVQDRLASPLVARQRPRQKSVRWPHPPTHRCLGFRGGSHHFVPSRPPGNPRPAARDG